MPSLIETRPFTIHPELYAWPSFLIFSRRAIGIYLLVLAILSALLVFGLALSPAMGILLAAGLVGAAFGMTYLRYVAFLRKPENRAIFRNCVVSLDGDRVRQDFTDGSYMEIQLFAVASFHETRDFYFLFATRRHGIVVPKTAFDSPEEAANFARRVKDRGAIVR